MTVTYSTSAIPSVKGHGWVLETSLLHHKPVKCSIQNGGCFIEHYKQNYDNTWRHTKGCMQFCPIEIRLIT